MFDNNKPIVVLYHIQQINEWEKLYQEQINSLIVSGLYENCEKIFIGINGDKELPFVLDKITYFYNKDQSSTNNSLEYIWNFCNNVDNEYDILYMHTLGVGHTKSSPFFLEKSAWRLYLEYFNIHKWKQCVGDLNYYDCVGVEWNEYSELTDQDTGKRLQQINPHYSGEFWWSKSEFIKKLDVNYLYNNEHGWLRFRSEFWLGTKNPNYKSYHNSNNNLYEIIYTPNFYIDKN